MFVVFYELKCCIWKIYAYDEVTMDRSVCYEKESFLDDGSIVDHRTLL